MVSFPTASLLNMTKLQRITSRMEKSYSDINIQKQKKCSQRKQRELRKETGTLKTFHSQEISTMYFHKIRVDD